MNLMGLRDFTADLITETSSIQNAYKEINRELELISNIVAIQNPSYRSKIQGLMTKIYDTIDKVNTVSNQCSDSIVKYTNESGELLDNLSFNLNKVVEHLNGINQRDV